MTSHPPQPTTTPPDAPPSPTETLLFSISIPVSSAATTRARLTELFPDSAAIGTSPDGAHAVLVLGNAAVQFHHSDEGAVPLLVCVCVRDVEAVRAVLRSKGVGFREGVRGQEGLEWLEFEGGDGFRWRVGRGRRDGGS